MPHDRRAVLLTVAAGLLLLVLVGRTLIPPSSGVPPASGDVLTASAAPPASQGPASGPVVVHVVGAVRRPGVYRLRAGSRVQDALRAAGGARTGAQLAALNLAERLADGEQVALPGRGVTLPTPASGGAGGPAAIVHLNSATPEQLDSLDGIGPALAARIVAYRAAHGGFRSADDLADVPGIGPAKLEALRGHVAP
jgi:competence protein ComEA